MASRVPILAVILATLAPGQSRVVQVTLDKPQFYGHCAPTRVHFTGRIRANGPMDVTYEWVRSGNAPRAEKTVHFVRAMEMVVEYDWNVVGDATGWLQLNVLSGQKLSTKSEFAIKDCP